MKPLRKRVAVFKIISAFLILILNAPYAVIFSSMAKEKILFLGVLDKDNTWMGGENLKWMKISFLSSKYDWVFVENNADFGGSLSPSDFQKITEEKKQEDVRKIIYGKIQETETSKNKNGAAITASFYVYDVPSKNTREIALTGLSLQKPGYSGSEGFLYDEALKDLSSQLVAFLDENNSQPERETKKIVKGKTKKSSSHRHSYFEDDNVFGSDLLDMIMGAGLLYMVFFQGKNNNSSSANSGGNTGSSGNICDTVQTNSLIQGAGSRKVTVSFSKAWSIKYTISPTKSGDNNFSLWLEDASGKTLTDLVRAEQLTTSINGTTQSIEAGTYILEVILNKNVCYKLEMG